MGRGDVDWFEVLAGVRVGVGDVVVGVETQVVVAGAEDEVGDGCLGHYFEAFFCFYLWWGEGVNALSPS